VSESFRGSVGRKVVSRSSAKELGSVSHLLVDARQRRIAAVVIGRGKKAQLVDWEKLSGFGPDAVMVVDEGARGLGVGETLTRAALDEARARGVLVVDLTSRPARTAAHRLYQKLGFATRETLVYRHTL